MNASMFNPKNVRVRELSNSVIVISVQDEKGNTSDIFFEDYEDFFHFSRSVSKGGILGIEYDLKTGQKVR